jgi:hypothetical protein
MRAAFLFPALILVSVTFTAWCSPLGAQWVLTAEVGADRFWGGSTESAGHRRSFRPYRPTTFGAGLERRSGRLGAGLRLGYASAALALEAADAVVAVKGIFDVYSAALEVSYRVTWIEGNELRVEAGPLLEVWGVSDESSETRVGLQAAVSLRVPLGGPFGGVATAGVAIAPSPFARDQLDQAFELRTLWRRRIAGGIQYRL